MCIVLFITSHSTRLPSTAPSGLYKADCELFDQTKEYKEDSIVDFSAGYTTWWRASTDFPEDEDWSDTGISTSETGVLERGPVLESSPVKENSDGYDIFI